MILVQDLPGIGKIHVVNGFFIPGKFEKRLDIAPDHGTFRGVVSGIFETLDLFLDAFLHLVGSLQLICLLLEMICLGSGGVLA